MLLYQGAGVALQRFRGAGNVTRLRGQLNTVDPWNLTQIMLAEGNK